MSYKYACSHFSTITDIPVSTIINFKEKPICNDCDCAGPNLWICLHRDCLKIGCSENFEDHSTLHNRVEPTHCIHMNLSTARVWCYQCEREVFMESTSATYNDSDQENEDCPTKSRDSGHGSYSTLRTDTPERGNIFAFERTVGLNVGMSGDTSESSDNEEASSCQSDRPVGLVGLQNIGNTCYMNAALQALSNTLPLTSFFLECSAAVQILSEGRKPGLSRTYQSLMREIWIKKNGGYVIPSGILYGIRNVHAMFRGYHQHDTQEFLRNFMDQLHEELKQISPPEPTNINDSDTFSLAMDEPALSSSYDSSEGEYETCDSGVSERSSLSDDTERPTNTAKRRLSRSSSPGRKLRARMQAASVIARSKRVGVTINKVKRRNGGIYRFWRTFYALPNKCRLFLNSQPSTSTASNNPSKKHIKYRSIISDIFDGKLLSSVQCLTCDRVSSRVETFQDLSLPIPSRDHLVVLHGRNAGPATTCSEAVLPVQDGWVSWILAWLRSWFYGPTVTLHDCLAAFFSTDELKGDNMYSCEKCNKLRNGIKFSKVLQLPEVLCIHLKRFRHELMFSSKISSAVSFPLKGLDMRPYLHTDCISRVTVYELFSVICHHGTAGGGHYTCYALNSGQWYEFDDQYVTRVTPETVQACEAYVLFYKKVTATAEETKAKVIEISEMCGDAPEDIAYISRQWLSRFNTCAEPGPIDNSDFLCSHGLVHPERAPALEQLTVILPLSLCDFLYKKFGGCPPLTSVSLCPACQALQRRVALEMENFVQLNRDFRKQDKPKTHLLSTTWYTLWENFIQKRNAEPPGPIDNSKINLSLPDFGGDCIEINEEIWNFFYNIYGGGPEIRIRQKIVNNSDGNAVGETEMFDFIIPGLKKQDKCDKIDKTIYNHGEPMESETIWENTTGTNDIQASNEDGGAESVKTDSNQPGISSGQNSMRLSSSSNTSLVDEDSLQGDTSVIENRNIRKNRRRKNAVNYYSSIN